MSNVSIFTGRSTVDSGTLGEQIWDAVLKFYVDWINAVRSEDGDGAALAEQELRFFALAFASLMVDGTSVSTGRKAIIRSMYARLGDRATIANVTVMLDAVIRAEEAAARNGASPTPSA